jgi:hypothetical protein
MQRKYSIPYIRRLARPIALAAIGAMTVATLVGVNVATAAQPAAGIPSAAAAQPTGGGSATPHASDFRAAAKAAHLQTPHQAAPGSTRKLAPTLAPHISSQFDGISRSQGCSVCTVPDPSAASSPSQIVELANRFIQVTNRTGVVQCGGGITLNQLFRSSDQLIKPRLQYDMVNKRFSLITMIIQPGNAIPAMYAAATRTADACGIWNVYRITMRGSPFPANMQMDLPTLGQDAKALLVSTRNVNNGLTFTLFGLPKSVLYNNSTLSFNTFSTASPVAPVTTAGNPMVPSPSTYFLGSLPGFGYRLYRLSNSGGSGATLTLQADISAPFTAPTRPARQPNAISLDTSEGDIRSTPYFDGSKIWFTHVRDFGGFPTVRYGAVNVANNTAVTADAFHGNTTDDFNPSIAVGISPAGPIVYLSWVFTDADAGQGVSLTVNQLQAGQSITTLSGSDLLYFIGSVSDSSNSLYGEYSSASIDAGITNGNCAISAQEYFGTDGTWRTRVARLGNC